MGTHEMTDIPGRGPVPFGAGAPRLEWAFLHIIPEGASVFGRLEAVFGRIPGIAEMSRKI